MTCIFRAKTEEGYIIKILAELLQHNIKTACFLITDKGIYLRTMDTHRKILIDLELFGENFSYYECLEKIFIGINVNHFHKMLKSIKKKDSVELFINSENRNDLGIRVFPKENNRITTSYIKIQTIQNIDIDLPDGYGKPIVVPANEYQKMCKDMNNIGTKIDILSKDFYIKFICDAGSVYLKEVEFGENKDVNNTNYSYSQTFDTEQLIRIIKISGLCPKIQIFVKNELPILFKNNIGTLGKIQIFIKSKKQLDEEHLQNDS